MSPVALALWSSPAPWLSAAVVLEADSSSSNDLHHEMHSVGEVRAGQGRVTSDWHDLPYTPQGKRPSV